MSDKPPYSIKNVDRRSARGVAECSKQSLIREKVKGTHRHNQAENTTVQVWSCDCQTAYPLNTSDASLVPSTRAEIFEKAVSLAVTRSSPNGEKPQSSVVPS